MGFKIDDIKPDERWLDKLIMKHLGLKYSFIFSALREATKKPPTLTNIGQFAVVGWTVYLLCREWDWTLWMVSWWVLFWGLDKILKAYKKKKINDAERKRRLKKLDVDKSKFTKL